MRQRDIAESYDHKYKYNPIYRSAELKRFNDQNNNDYLNKFSTVNTTDDDITNN